jgi:hypothetical protein
MDDKRTHNFHAWMVNIYSGYMSYKI